jgi:undecaprenyl-diphosphatase
MQSELFTKFTEVDLGLVQTITAYAQDHPWLAQLGYFSAQWLLPLMFIVLFVLWYAPRSHFERSRILSSQKTVVLTIVGLATSLAVKSALVFVAYRDRPYIADSGITARVPSQIDPGSLPSAHSMLAFTLAVSLYCAGYRRAGLLLGILALFVAVGRVVIGVHYPSDVLVGAILGSAIAWILHRESGSLKRYLPN